VKKILIFVSTLDGKITKWGDPHIRSWSSKNDQDHFDLIWNDTRIIVMGNNTYKPDPVKPSAKHLFVVMTRNPVKYKSKEIPGQLEFTKESPAQLVSRFEKEGEEKMLIVGGAQIATSFLRAQLIDELWLTIEPKIFGQGGNFVIEEKLDINLKLVSCTRVNNLGTLVTKYMVERTIEI
jgi:dihydrofolate reductase